MSKRSKSAKADVADKVKEIKLRQQSWFQQRDREKSGTRNTNDNQTLCTANVPRTAKSPEEQSQHVKKVPLVGRTQVISEGREDGGAHSKTGFHTWLEARKTDSNNFIVRQEKTKSDEGFQDGLPLTQEMFDTAADKIAARVKMEMRLGERQDGDGDDSISSFVSEEQLAESILGLDSHRCRICNKVMVSPYHSPTLLIPCGHSFCMSCTSHQTNCPRCNCCVESTTSNTMLEKIITEYSSSPVKESQSDSTGVKTSKMKTKEKNEKDYVTEFNHLNLRCEVLQSESEDIRYRLKDMEGQIRRQEKQIRSIDRQDVKIQAEITALQEQLEQLRENRKDFEEQIGIIEGKKDEAEEKLKIVQETIAELSQSAIKAKTMAKRLRQDMTRYK